MDMEKLLQSVGCNTVEATKTRFLDDPEFYLEILAEMLEDPGFEVLGERLKAKDAAASFDTAHMLKGIIGNCGIAPLYDCVVRIVDPLRGEKPDFGELEQTYVQMLGLRDELKVKLRDSKR